MDNKRSIYQKLSAMKPNSSLSHTKVIRLSSCRKKQEARN